MSINSTDTAWVTTDVPQAVKMISKDDMIVSYTRHRRSADDVTYTYQFPLTQVVPRETRKEFLVRVEAFLLLKLEVPLEDDYSVVWRMSETGQIAFMRDQGSFDAAVLDHKHANKQIIQLFVVRNDNIHDLPSLEFSK
ncbi:hypothetical protein KCU91_g9807, partial [Aureobasidium melanogenum]